MSINRKKLLIVAVSDNPHELRQQLNFCNAFAVENNCFVVDTLISNSQMGLEKRVSKVLHVHKIKRVVVSEPKVGEFFFRKDFRPQVGRQLYCADTEATLEFFRKCFFLLFSPPTEIGNTGGISRNKRSQAQGPIGHSNIDGRDVAMTTG